MTHERTPVEDEPQPPLRVWSDPEPPSSDAMIDPQADTHITRLKSQTVEEDGNYKVSHDCDWVEYGPSKEETQVLEDSYLGQRVGRFQILTLLGVGTFGMVYRAHDPVLDREVALKIPRFDGELHPDLLDKFTTEARTAARLNHPNIVTVYEAGFAAGIFYIAVAYCSGPTLAHWLSQREEALSVELAVEIVADLAGAIHRAHQAGILHRDIKPQNILLEPDEEGWPQFPFVPKIADFGLAKVVSHASHSSENGEVVGTARYMAPEQAAAQNKSLTPAVDVYSLGTLLYELLTGKPPFMASGYGDTLAQVLHEQPRPPSEVREDIPPSVEMLCLKCLAKQPEERFASARDLESALRISLHPSPRTRPTAQPAQSRTKVNLWQPISIAIAIGIAILSLLPWLMAL